MTIRSLYPDVEPTLNLDFTRLKRLPASITFTRASTGTYVNQSGIIQAAAINRPRLTYDPSTLKPLGLLVEEARTNLFTYSEDFSSGWSNTNSTELTNVITAPNGNLAADRIVEDAGAVTPSLSQTPAVVAGTTYTFSCYAKEDATSAKRYFMLMFAAANFGANIRCVVNLGTGAISSVGSPLATSITSVGDGWYRVSVTATATVSGTPAALIRITNDAGGSLSSYTGDGTSGIYVWGAQLEAGAFPTSYIPTTSTAATREADVATITGTNFSRWYRQDEGTLYSDFTIGLDSDGSRFFADIDNGSNTEAVEIRSDSIGLVRGVIAAGGSQQANISASAPAIGSSCRAAIVYIVNNFAFTVNGATPTSDFAGNTPTAVNRLNIGSFGGVGNFVNTPISRLIYWPARLSNTNLQELTR